MDSKIQNEDETTLITNEDETATLIELLEERGCLWNVFCKESFKRDVRQKCYSDIVEIQEKPVEAVTVKINGLQEINKKNKTKSVQGSDKQ